MQAQLILVGGRPMPNMLTILHQKPDIIVAIVSRDREEEIPYLKSAVQELLKDLKLDCAIDTSFIVDAFNLAEIKSACESALEKYQEANWLFNITSATTIMSIGAYEIAQAHTERVKWWYLDTAHTSIVTPLGGEKNEKLFEITVQKYLTASYCALENGDMEDYRIIHETRWLPFAQSLGRGRLSTPKLKDLLRIIRDINRAENRQIAQFTPQIYDIEKLSDETLKMLEEAANVGIVDNWYTNDTRCSFRLTEPQYKFLDGTWLEVYTWKAIQQTGIFTDYEWGKKIKDRYNRWNQLDAAMIYKAQLLIVECKTGSEAFQSKTFQTLESISNALGRNFVTKLLVTSLPVTDDDVNSRAKSSSIFIIQKDDLPNIETKLISIAKGDRRL